MKNLTIILTVFITLVAVPALAKAGCGSCSVDHKAAGDKKEAVAAKGHEGHDHSGMAAKGDLLDLGSKGEKGVKASASMKDVKAAMTKMGMKTTHHFMVSFLDEKTGKPVDAGTAALKINDPDGVATGPMALMGMQGHFGADVILDKPGEYKFQIGSKLADGQTRQYEFKTSVK
jgi:hypothetical protein